MATSSRSGVVVKAVPVGDRGTRSEHMLFSFTQPTLKFKTTESIIAGNKNSRNICPICVFNSTAKKALSKVYGINVQCFPCNGTNAKDVYLTNRRGKRRSLVAWGTRSTSSRRKQNTLILLHTLPKVARDPCPTKNCRRRRRGRRNKSQQWNVGVPPPLRLAWHQITFTGFMYLNHDQRAEHADCGAD